MEAPLEALVPSAGSDKLPYRLTHDLRHGTALNLGHCLELAGQVRVESQHHVLHFGHSGIVVSRYRPVKSRRPHPAVTPRKLLSDLARGGHAMPKTIKGNAGRKPPGPSASHSDIDDWFRRLVPHLQPIVERLDE